MNFPLRNDSASRSTTGQRSHVGSRRTSETERPALTPGFGSVMGLEHELQDATESSMVGDNGPHSDSILRILWHQRSLIAANIALLEQRYEMLPHPLRFHLLEKIPSTVSLAHRAVRGGEGVLASLIALHGEVVDDIGRLIAKQSDGQSVERVLAEILRHHEEMVWMLEALLKEDDTVRDRQLPPVIAGHIATAAEHDWENEGGAPANN